jgi:validoxylamine A glucosyltransferase
MASDRHVVSPAVSVVIPTYNRQELLRNTLESLAAQRFDLNLIQVIISDDGSSDATADVSRSFAGKLRLEYHFQPDEGFRLAEARNNGARLATAPVVIFLDTGVLAGPDLVSAHLAEHRSQPYGVHGPAVLGYTYGYNIFEPYQGLEEILARCTPSEAHDLLRDEAGFRDMRHREFERFEFDLSRMLTPWVLFWNMNMSVRTADFRAVGGFDQAFRSWGGEDVDLGWRLASHGVHFVLSREAWAIESPHERDLKTILVSTRRNVVVPFEKTPALLTEMYAAIYSGRPPAPLEDEYRALLAWAEKIRVTIAEPDWGLRPGEADGKRVVVFGCGATPAPTGPAWTLVDFDEQLLRARRDSGAPVHGLGVRTPYPDKSFDIAVVTSRLGALWPRWGEEIRQEAARLAPEIRLLISGG